MMDTQNIPITKLIFETGCYVFKKHRKRADCCANCQSLVFCPGSSPCSDSVLEMPGCVYDIHEAGCSLKKCHMLL